MTKFTILHFPLLVLMFHVQLLFSVLIITQPVLKDVVCAFKL